MISEVSAFLGSDLWEFSPCCEVTPSVRSPLKTYLLVVVLERHYLGNYEVLYPPYKHAMMLLLDTHFQFETICVILLDATK